MSKNFQRHREDVHLPTRRRLGLAIQDRDKLGFENQAKTRYHARDIRSMLFTLDAATKAWETKYNMALGS